MRTDNLRITRTRPLIAPASLEEEIPLTEETAGIGRIWGDAKLLRDESGNADRVEGGIRIYLGDQEQLPDSVVEANESFASGHRGLAHVFFDTFQLADFGNRPPNLQFEVIERDGTVNIIDVMTTMLEDSGMEPECYDLSCLQRDPFIGYAVQRVLSARGVAEQLQSLFPFDVANTGYKLLFRPRNRNLDAIIDADDLAATSDTDNRPERRERFRKQDLELPKEILIQYFDPNRDYQTNTARSRRIRMDSRNVDRKELPIVMHPRDIKGRVDTLAARNHVERHSETWRLPWKYAYLDASDLVTIPREDGSLPRYRIVKMATGINGVIEVELTRDQFYWQPGMNLAAVINVRDSGIGREVNGVPDTWAFLMNLPLLADTNTDDPSFYIGLSTDDLQEWGGANLFGSIDGVEYTAVFATTRAATAGFSTTALPDAEQTSYIDRNQSVTVELINGTLSSITLDKMFGTTNVAVLGDEIIRFQTATLIAPSTYVLSNIKRGVRGTEHQTATHVVGERFVLLTTATVLQFAHTATQTNVSRFFKAATFRQSLDEVGSPTQELTFASNAANLRPWSGICAEATRNGAGDITITWLRRDRRETTMLNLRGLAQSEETESYEVEVQGGSPQRTLTSTSPSVTYTAAQQTEDFGSTQNPVSVRIYQMSAKVGRGVALEATL
jgi:hypothetical protein